MRGSTKQRLSVYTNISIYIEPREFESLSESVISCKIVSNSFAILDKIE